jgi:hypothetical protein
MPYFSLPATLTGNATQLQGRAVSATAPAANQVLAWSGSTWLPATGVTGPTGADGSRFYGGSGAPSAWFGNARDFWLDTTNGRLYGPKADGSWGSPLQLQSGAAGPTGVTGATGPAGQSYTGPSGVDGSTGPTGATGAAIVAVGGTPNTNVGRDGDFAFDVTGKTFYGPKAAGAWPAGLSLLGPTGPTGSLTINDVIAAVGSNATLRAAIKSAANS